MAHGIVIIASKHLDRDEEVTTEVHGHVPKHPAEQREALRRFVRDVHPDADIKSFNPKSKVAGFVAKDHLVTAEVVRVSTSAAPVEPPVALF